MHRSSDPDTFTARQLRCRLARFDFDSLPYFLSVVLQVYSKGLTQAAGAACQFLHFTCFPPLTHPIKSSSRFDGTDQDSTRAFAIRGEIQAIVHSINEIYIHIAERVLHYHRLCWPHYRMRCGVSGVGFGFDNPSFTPFDDEDRSYEVASDFG